MTVEILAIGAHPDDADIGVGGILCAAAAAGHTVDILDLSQGELGTRGTPAERAAEALEAARILGIRGRHNAHLPDGGIANTPEQRVAVVRHLRHLRPRIVLSPMGQDRHPDHDAAHELVRDALHLAGLSKLACEGSPHRPERVFYYRVYGDDSAPACVVNVTPVFDTKLEALRAFRSQFHNPSYDAPETFVSSPAFWDGIKTRAAYWGSRIGVAYAEPLHTLGPLGVDSLPGLETTA